MDNQLEPCLFIQYWDENSGCWSPSPLSRPKLLTPAVAKKWLRGDKKMYPNKLFRLVHVEFHVIEEDGQ